MINSMKDFRKILIVDDEELMRMMLENFFKNHGFSVYTTSGSDGVLDLIESESIRIIIVDLKLLRESGLDLGTKIMKKFPSTVRIAMTGYPSAYELRESRESGFDDYFRKPLNLELLLQKIESAVVQLHRWNS